MLKECLYVDAVKDEILLIVVKNKSMSLGVYELNHKCASTSDLITRTRTSTCTHILLRDKTRVQMFYLDSNTTVPL